MSWFKDECYSRWFLLYFEKSLYERNCIKEVVHGMCIARLNVFIHVICSFYLCFLVLFLFHLSHFVESVVNNASSLTSDDEDEENDDDDDDSAEGSGDQIMVF